MEFHALGAAHPGMEKFVFNFDASRQDDHLTRWNGLFHVHAVIDSDARLQMRDVDERSAQIFAELFELSGALSCCPCGPGLDAQEHYDHHYCDDQRDQGQRDWPGNS